MMDQNAAALLTGLVVGVIVFMPIITIWTYYRMRVMPARREQMSRRQQNETPIQQTTNNFYVVMVAYDVQPQEEVGEAMAQLNISQRQAKEMLANGKILLLPRRTGG